MLQTYIKSDIYISYFIVEVCNEFNVEAVTLLQPHLGRVTYPVHGSFLRSKANET